MDPIDQIKAKIDIVDLISSYVPLKKMGRNFAARCPFHQETKPSFMISPDRQIFRCFGCEKKGDIFGFIQEKEGFTFRESLEFLAKKAGVTLPRYDKKTRDQKERLTEINTLAAKLYRHILLNTRTGAAARKYLESRGIQSALWEKFNLGFAPPQPVLEKFLTKAGFGFSEIAQSGILVAGDFGRFFDRFRQRLIFPIFNLQGAVVGFSGRVINSQQEPKYLNSPETLIFQKGSNLYGLNLAKDAVKATGFAILVEGEFDVIASHVAGVENVVAVKGTALTDDQIKLISRFTDQISLCFDVDLAGDAAARRGIELADRAGLNIKVIRIARAKDPDEAVRKSKDLWIGSVESAIPVYDWLIEEVFGRYDGKTAYGAKKISDEILPALARISDEVVRAHYFQKLASKLSLTEEALWEKAAKFKNLGKVEISETQEEQAEPVSRHQKLSEYYLALLLAGHQFVNSRKDWLDPEAICTDLRNFYQEIIISTLGAGDFDIKNFSASLVPENLKILDGLLFINLGQSLESAAVFESELKKTVQALGQLYYKEKIAQTLSEIKAARQDKDNSDKLAANLNGFLQKLASLQKE